MKSSKIKMSVYSFAPLIDFFYEREQLDDLDRFITRMIVDLKFFKDDSRPASERKLGYLLLLKAARLKRDRASFVRHLRQMQAACLSLAAAHKRVLLQHQGDFPRDYSLAQLRATWRSLLDTAADADPNAPDIPQDPSGCGLSNFSSSSGRRGKSDAQEPDPLLAITLANAYDPSPRTPSAPARAASVATGPPAELGDGTAQNILSSSCDSNSNNSTVHAHKWRLPADPAAALALVVVRPDTSTSKSAYAVRLASPSASTLHLCLDTLASRVYSEERPATGSGRSKGERVECASRAARAFALVTPTRPISRSCSLLSTR
jgi:hypothetical protein